MAVIVVEVGPDGLGDLRRRVLHDGRPHDGFPEDHEPTTVHLAVTERAGGDEDLVVGAATFVARGEGVWQLRGMAVEPARQCTGVGRAILLDGIARLQAGNARLLWANGRDTALGFYERVGFTVVGDGYDMVGLPHHRIELTLL